MRISGYHRFIITITDSATLLSGCGKKSDSVAEAAEEDKKGGIAAPSIAVVKQIAKEGFIYGRPLIMGYTANYEFWIDKTSSQCKGPMGHLFNERRVFTPKDTAVITPNSDTPYSFVCCYLRAEPWVISVPAVKRERYYSVMHCHFNTFNFGYIGSRATGPDAGDYLIAGPDWKGETPAGIKKVFHSSTQLALAVFRTHLFNAADMPNVTKIQDAYQVWPLSVYQKSPAPPAAPPLDFPKAKEELAKTNFFEYVDWVFHIAPPGPEEKEIRAKLAMIGIGPGKTFHFKDLSLEHKAALLLGMKEGEKKMEASIPEIGKKTNGWNAGSAFGDRSFYKGDWLLRAAATKAGIYGNDAVEAMYPVTRWLPHGEVLDSSKHNYTLNFPAGQLPPVNAFWSVTMYDDKTQLLIDNPLNRYLINSPMLPGMRKNDDGSLTLYIQKECSGADKEANWLPAPNGPIYMVMRLCWPRRPKLHRSCRRERAPVPRRPFARPIDAPPAHLKNQPLP